MNYFAYEKSPRFVYSSSQVCLTTLSMKLATSARLPADTDNAHLHHGCTVIFLLDESLHDLPIQ